MHAGRRLPHCLILGLALTACTSPRYVGSIGRDGTYSNRGYGLAVRLDVNGLGERWDAIDPTEREKVPKSVRPKRKTDPIDVDGDGLLEVTERQEHMVPTLRLLSRTSSTARIDIDVLILGGANQTAPIDALMALELKQRVDTSTAGVGEGIAKMIRRTVAPDFDARVAEISTSKGFYRVALIDHGDFLAEEGIKRRQMIKVLLSAKQRSAPMIEDHDKLLDAVILNRRGSSTSVREQW